MTAQNTTVQADQAIQQLRQQLLKGKPEDITSELLLQINALYNQAKELKALAEFAARAGCKGR